MEREGWQLVKLSGPYKRFGSHNEAFLKFVERVESLMRSFEDEYVKDVVIIGRTSPELGDTTAERGQLDPHRQ
jgi:hypothetical protein